MSLGFGSSAKRKQPITLFDDPARDSSTKRGSALGEEQKPFGDLGLVFLIVLSTPTLAVAFSYFAEGMLSSHAVFTAWMLALVLLLVRWIAVICLIIQFGFTLFSFYKLRASGALSRWVIVAGNLVTIALLWPAIEKLLSSS
ncbi:MAG TPA: hypothetical protein VK738_07305 [Terriglobales bacterium]|jgi:hypothetical protein|nr:hypothetical protein [Terriglobales bacterium]